METKELERTNALEQAIQEVLRGATLDQIVLELKRRGKLVYAVMDGYGREFDLARDGLVAIDIAEEK